MFFLNMFENSGLLLRILKCTVSAYLLNSFYVYREYVLEAFDIFKLHIQHAKSSVYVFIGTGA